MPNYLVYPFRIMRITQRYDGSTSHLPHMMGKPSEYATDEGGVDAGRDWLYCPCDEMKIVRIYGVGAKGINTIWLVSTSKCDLANGKKSIVTIIITHPNDDDLKRLKVGQTIKRGHVICREGIDGASGNHIHMAVGLGTITGNGWACNSKKKWVLTTTGGPIKPEEAFFVDSKITTIKDSKKLKFKMLPNDSAVKKDAKYKNGTYRVTTSSVLKVRSGPGKDNPAKTFDELSADARKQIKALNNNKEASGFVKGVTFNVTKVDGEWGKCKSGWVCLNYCEVVS